jgi:O-antigen ligase
VGIAAGSFIFGRTLSWSPGDYGATLKSIAEHRSGTGKGRLIQYSATLRMLADHPFFGVGPGQWSIAYPSYAEAGDPTYRPQQGVPVNRLPNSDWLGLAAERGLPALGISFLIGILLLRRAVIHWNTDGRDAAALVAIIAALFVVGTFDAVLFRPEMAYLAALALGATAGSCATRRKWQLVRLSRWFYVAAASLCLVITVAFSGSRMAAAIIRGDGRIRDLERAFKLDPGNYMLATEIAYRHAAFRHCDSAASYARAALRLYPAARLPLAALRVCDTEGTD